MLTRSERQSLLLESFGFSCICTACSHSNEKIQDSDEKILYFIKLRKCIGPIVEFDETQSLKRRLRDVKRAECDISLALAILSTEKKIDARGDLLMQRFCLAANQGDGIKASRAAKEVYKHYSMTIGKDAVDRMNIKHWCKRPDLAPQWKLWERTQRKLAKGL